MGQRRRRRPSRGLADKQEKFVRLIAQGVINSEACRLVGINRRTGTRWRFGRTILNAAGESVHYPPVRIQRLVADGILGGRRCYGCGGVVSAETASAQFTG
jgi:hypothetical protein